VRSVIRSVTSRPRPTRPRGTNSSGRGRRGTWLASDWTPRQRRQSRASSISFPTSLAEESRERKRTVPREDDPEVRLGHRAVAGAGGGSGGAHVGVGRWGRCGRLDVAIGRRSPGVHGAGREGERAVGEGGSTSTGCERVRARATADAGLPTQELPALWGFGSPCAARARSFELPGRR
jgi:hypothetical protein